MRILLSALLMISAISNILAAPAEQAAKVESARPAVEKHPLTPAVMPGQVSADEKVLESPAVKASVVTAEIPSAEVNPKAKAQAVNFKSLTQMNELIRLGVPALALSLLQGEQKKRKIYSPDWYSFEYKRIVLLSALEQWQRLIQRVDWLFATTTEGENITIKIQLWFETQQVIARLQLKQSEQALLQLQRLLWQTNSEFHNPGLSVLWRQLIIRSYLQMHNDDDARKALLKYELDYSAENKDIDWLLLQSQVLLRTGRPQQAIDILQQIPGDEALALTLIARLQSNPEQAEKINAEMRVLLDGQILSRYSRWLYSYVAYTASTLIADLPSQILNMEAMLSLNIESPMLDESYRVSADDLWALYSQLGLIVANNKGLLLGNNDQWLQLSEKLIKDEPEYALALNATLVLQTDSFDIRQQQHRTIVEILEQRKDGLALINQLYLHSDKVNNVDVLPDEVRYRLVDYALAQGNYFEAATLMDSLQEPPDGKSLFDWRMRNARVLILQGGYQQSENLIRKTFADKKSITHAELDRFIQVVFDFQTVQQHQQALALFDLISFLGLEEKLKREIYFWKAESHFALKHYDQAALHYLSSAHAVKDAENDLWAQSARFKAGNALVLAAIYDDAEKVFSELLLITASESRKALINQNLQKIRLLKSTLTGINQKAESIDAVSGRLQ